MYIIEPEISLDGITIWVVYKATEEGVKIGGLRNRWPHQTEELAQEHCDELNGVN